MDVFGMDIVVKQVNFQKLEKTFGKIISEINEDFFYTAHIVNQRVNDCLNSNHIQCCSHSFARYISYNQI